MTEAVSLGELLYEEALLVLLGGTLIPVWTLPLRHISSSLSVARPFTNGVEWGWKKCTDPMVGGARSITLYDACTPSSACEELRLAYSSGKNPASQATISVLQFFSIESSLKAISYSDYGSNKEY